MHDFSKCPGVISLDRLNNHTIAVPARSQKRAPAVKGFIRELNGGQLHGGHLECFHACGRECLT
jgi:hypothetical protein